MEKTAWKLPISPHPEPYCMGWTRLLQPLKYNQTKSKCILCPIHILYIMNKKNGFNHTGHHLSHHPFESSFSFFLLKLIQTINNNNRWWHNCHNMHFQKHLKIAQHYHIVTWLPPVRFPLSSQHKTYQMKYKASQTCNQILFNTFDRFLTI